MECTMKLRKHPRLKTSPLQSKSKQHKKKQSNKKKYPPAQALHLEFPEIWNELRNNMQLCDGVIKCEDQQEFKIHRAIVSAVSPYFKAMFLNILNRGEPEMTEVSIEVPGEYLSLILDYAYTGYCTVTTENVQNLLVYADRLEFVGIVQMCSQYILDHLDSNNCLDVYKFGAQFFCPELEDKGRKFIRHNFREVMDSNPNFYELSASELEDILSDDELNAKAEEMVFEAIKLWVEHDIESRRAELPKLLRCVRLGLIPCQFYTSEILKWELIEQNNKCREVLQKAINVLSVYPGDHNPPYHLRELVPRPRMPYEVLFAIGGWTSGSPTSFIETYDCRADRWLLCVHHDVTPRAYHGLCTLAGLIYVIGGFDGNEHFNTMRSFNPVTKEWRDHACMYYPRCYVSVALHNGKIYALGGYNGRSRMNSAERYDPDCNQWELIACMNRQRSDASAAVLRDKIYIAGGFNGNEVLHSAEMYDPIVNQWSFITPMGEARSGVSLLSFRDALYAFGGFNGYDRLSSAEKYLVDTAQWVYIPKMLNPRSNFASVVLDDLIFVVGGFNGATTIAGVESFNVDRNEWKPACDMNLNRSALSACVLSGLSNCREYSHVYKHCMRTGLPEAS